MPHWKQLKLDPRFTAIDDLPPDLTQLWVTAWSATNTHDIIQITGNSLTVLLHPWEGCKVLWCVCACACVRVCVRACLLSAYNWKTKWPNFTMAVARSSSDGVVYIVYFRSYGWLSDFRFYGWRHVFMPMGRIKHSVMFRRSLPGGGTSWRQCLVEFTSSKVCHSQLTVALCQLLWWLS